MISKDIKMTDLLMNNHFMIFVLERFGIELGLQDKTIEEVCKDYNLSTRVFLTIINLHHNSKYNSKIFFNNSEIKDIIKYLRNGHKYYADEVLVEISKNIDSLNEFQSEPEILMVKEYFDDYYREVKQHFDFENETVFPYVIELIDNLKQLNNFSIKEYKEHHDNIDEKLYDLRKLLIQYIPSNNDIKIRRIILIALDILENDILIHTKIEDEIIIPFVENMERSIAIEK